MTIRPDEVLPDRLIAAGLPMGDVASWLSSPPRTTTGGLPIDSNDFASFWRRSAGLLARLPAKPRRNPAEHAAAEMIKQHAREARLRFLQAHVEAL
jgi:hypothetical protein